MPDHTAIRRPTPHRPLGAFGTVRIAGIKSQPCDDKEDMAVARINADPLAFAGPSVTAKLRGSRRLAQSTGGTQDIRSRSGAIVGVINTLLMTGSVLIRQTGNSVSRRNRRLHFRWRRWRGYGDAGVQLGGFARDVVIDIGRRFAASQTEGDKGKKHDYTTATKSTCNRSPVA